MTLWSLRTATPRTRANLLVSPPLPSPQRQRQEAVTYNAPYATVADHLLTAARCRATVSTRKPPLAEGDQGLPSGPRKDDPHSRYDNPGPNNRAPARLFGGVYSGKGTLLGATSCWLI